jgi:type I restriction enzyme, S subunit
MIKNWQIYKLGKIAEIIMGQSPAGETCNEKGEGIELLNGPTEFGSHYPIPKQYTTDPKKLSQIGDILFCVRGSTTGRMNWSDRKYAIGRGLAAIRHKEGENYRYFLKGIIDNNLKNLLGLATGSTFPNIGGDQLRQFEIPVPDLPTQLSIASILSSLDDKIELNLQMNQTLETMAQTIFKEWFVNFNFPGFDGALVNGLPKGWRKGKLGDLFDFVKGVSYRSSELVKSKMALVTLKSINRFGGLNYNGFKEFEGKYKERQVLDEGDVIIAQTDITQAADVIGCPAIVENPLNYEKLIASIDLVKCVPKTNYFTNLVLFYFLIQKSFKDYCLSHTNGSTVLHLRSSELPNYEFIIPNIETLVLFNEIINLVRRRIIINNNQNQTLATTRNSLLPKLMTGKIELN